MLLGLGLVEDAAGVLERGIRRRILTRLAIQAAEFHFGIGDPRRLPSGAAFEDADRGDEGAARLVVAVQRFVGEAEIVEVVGDERMGRAEPALIDSGGLFNERQRVAGLPLERAQRLCRAAMSATATRQTPMTPAAVARAIPVIWVAMRSTCCIASVTDIGIGAAGPGLTLGGLRPRVAAQRDARGAMNQTEQAIKAELFRAMHSGPPLLLLPNAWDAISARIVIAAGFHAIATTSGGVAWALGYPDGEAAPWDEVVAATARIARAVAVPVTADIEIGLWRDAGGGRPFDPRHHRRRCGRREPRRRAAHRHRRRSAASMTPPRASARRARPPAPPACRS